MDVFRNLRNLKILLIDDDIWIRDSLKALFESEACNLQAFETAEEGLEEIQKKNYDLIIVDYKLPAMDGLEFLKQLPVTEPKPIKILITAYRTDDLIAKAKKLHIGGFIEKPFDSGTLLASLAFLINQHNRELKKNSKFVSDDPSLEE